MSNQTEETALLKVKAHLENGLAISPLYALNKFGCFRLADVVYKLRKNYGMDIKTELARDNGKVFARYRM
jgi:hypothetical protein